MINKWRYFTQKWSSKKSLSSLWLITCCLSNTMQKPWENALLVKESGFFWGDLASLLSPQPRTSEQLMNLISVLFTFAKESYTSAPSASSIFKEFFCALLRSLNIKRVTPTSPHRETGRVITIGYAVHIFPETISKDRRKRAYNDPLSLRML